MDAAQPFEPGNAFVLPVQGLCRQISCLCHYFSLPVLFAGAVMLFKYFITERIESRICFIRISR
jgi:hypothetical protein